MTSEKLKKELSLIDSIIVHSRTILAIKIALKEQRKTLFLVTRLPIHILVADKIKEVISELEYNLNNLEINVSRLTTKALAGRGIIVPEKFYLSGSDLKVGYCVFDQLVKLKDGKTMKLQKYLLLSDCSKGIVDFKQGFILDDNQLNLIEDIIPSVLGNMADIYKITSNSKCSIVESNLITI